MTESARKIPWHEPEFSRRMLAEHLTQQHDAASRRFRTVDAHVDWIHEKLLGAERTQILDLGCGPGLYTSRLAAHGHACTGIDFSPASIEHARSESLAAGDGCRYLEGDLRDTAFPGGNGLVMLVFGEFNTFTEAELSDLLARAQASLLPGGRLLLEPSDFESVRAAGLRAPVWHTADRGLFSDQPYMCLKASAWDEERATALDRWYVIDPKTSEVREYVGTSHAYTEPRLRELLGGAGFEEIEIRPAWGADAPTPDGLFTLTARRRG